MLVYHVRSSVFKSSGKVDAAVGNEWITLKRFFQHIHQIGYWVSRHTRHFAVVDHTLFKCEEAVLQKRYIIGAVTLL